MNRTLSLTQPGTFIVGCNYWASHAGTAMWSDWRGEIVEQDLAKLTEAGIEVLRVFPLWPDFQPLQRISPRHEYRLGEEPLANDELGQAGLSATAMTHFAEFTALAERHRLKLIVGLITGWMSGRLFVPRAFERCNVITDPAALMWQVRFVRCFVRHFARSASILAWDLGNECNCMGAVSPDPSRVSREAAWLWTQTITGAIRLEDRARPVVSGMHDLALEPRADLNNSHWLIQDQAELTDVLTTHPYPIFTPYCALDPLNTLKSCLHATAQTCLYADVGGRPCLAEEVGTLGPMLSSEKIAADYLRANLFSLWAHDGHGLLWWCAFDQGHLAQAPYDWEALERELGLFGAAYRPKAVLGELKRFRKFLDSFPFAALPPRRKEAVCLLSRDQDHWAVAYGAFVLAKQAGFDLEFQYVEQPLISSSLYLLPGIKGTGVMSRRLWLELRQRVQEGATLYISYDDGFLSEFEEVTGLTVETREQRRAGKFRFQAGSGRGRTELTMRGGMRLALASTRAEVLGAETDGNPVFCRAAYGKGAVYFLGFAMEQELTTRPGAFYGTTAEPCWKIYQALAKAACAERIASKTQPQVGLTEHSFDERQRLIIAINYAPEPARESFSLCKGWKVAKVLYGEFSDPDRATATIKPNDAMVFQVARSYTERHK
ncbi:MAG: beta-mannanase [Lentisphaerae bacterium]|nr:beta-mannanase [Lentisphaerota bacterium]